MTEQEWLASADPAAMLEYLTRGNASPHVAGGQGWRTSDRKLRLFACACARQVWHLLTDERSRKAVEEAERHVEGLDDPSRLTQMHGQAFRVPGSERPGPLMAAAECCNPDAARSTQQAAQLAVSTPHLKADLLREIIGNPFRPWMREDAFTRGDNLPGRTLHIVQSVWLTPTVVSLATTAYEERSGRTCEKCDGDAVVQLRHPPGWITVECHDCHGTGRIQDDTLDPFRLALVADALEEAGCVGAKENPCRPCDGHGTERQAAPDRGPAPKCSYCDGKGWRDWPHPIVAHLRSPGPHVRGCFALGLLLGKE